MRQPTKASANSEEMMNDGKEKWKWKWKERKREVMERMQSREFDLGSLDKKDGCGGLWSKVILFTFIFTIRMFASLDLLHLY